MGISVRRNWLICLCLIAITIAVYWQVGEFEFVHYDDDVYVTANEHVKSGITLGNVAWAMSAAPNGDWIPLTWMSFMADHMISAQSPLVRYEGQEDPHYYHLTNLVFHLANVLLLYAVLTALTGFRWRSAMVAALFAVHPLHVEPVAWVTGRKDLLSTFFMMLTILAYVWYVRAPGKGRYLLVALLFLLGLMSKSMLVTLPVALLLLDFWPLRRMAGSTGDSKTKGKTWKQLAVEKIPLAAICIAASVVAVIAQKSGGALRELSEYPIGVRLANALVSYVAYLWKMIWPVGLACTYSHPGSTIPVLYVILSGILLVGVTLVALRTARKRPALTVGWLWYLLTLLPTIGIVQFGIHGMADRFSYVTLTGVFVALVWMTCDLLPAGKARVPLLAVLAAAVLIPLSVRAQSQAEVWRDTRALFTHAIAVTTNNWEAKYYFANALFGDGEVDESIQYLLEAERLKPTKLGLHNNLGVAYSARGEVAKAREEFLAELRLNEESADALCNLAALEMNSGNGQTALRYAREATRVEPANERAQRTLQAIKARTEVAAAR